MVREKDKTCQEGKDHINRLFIFRLFKAAKKEQLNLHAHSAFANGGNTCRSPPEGMILATQADTSFIVC